MNDMKLHKVVPHFSNTNYQEKSLIN